MSAPRSQPSDDVRDRCRARSLRAAAGDTMIEVIVAALLLAILAGGVLDGLVAAIHTTADERRRAQADAVAEQDQNRLRGLPVSTLSGLNQTSTVTLDGTAFTVASTGGFVSASSGNVSCSSTATGTADYLEVQSSVTWPDMESGTPVTEQSIITPPPGGALVVQVLDENGNGVPNMIVSVTGTGANTTPNETATTPSTGCAVFGGLADGNYDVSVQQSGFVDPNGNSTPSSAQQAQTVVSGETAESSFEYAQAGAISATLQTRVGGVTMSSSADTVVAYQTNMAAPSYRVFGTPSTLSSNTYASTVASPTTVFPFATPYTVFSGSCLADEPSANGQTSDATATVTPGGTASVTIFQPALIVDVWSGTPTSKGSLLTTAPHITLTDTGCGNTEHYPATVVPNATTGALKDPGVPYGNFQVCADNNSGVFSVKNTATVDNDNPAGTTVNIYLGWGSPGRASGTCT